MNQAILFNDDLAFNKKENTWQFSGMVSGQKVVIEITSSVLPSQLSEHDKLDWELAAEDWLTEYEDIPPIIRLSL